MQHIIKKQIISLQLEQSLDSFRVQQQISDYFWREMVPLLEKEFDLISDETELISLDRVELDLGVILRDEINTLVWNTNLISQLRKEITVQKSMQFTAADKPFIQPTISTSSFQAWLFYMEQGYLPWNVLSINEHWQEQVIEELANHKHSRDKLRALVQMNEIPVLRIIRQHSLAFISRLVETLIAEKHCLLFEALQELSEQINEPELSKRNRSSLNQARKAALQVSYENALKDVLISAIFLKGNLEAITSAIQQVLKQKWKTEKEITEISSISGTKFVEIQAFKGLNQLVIPVSSAETTVYMEQLKEEGIYVEGLGLVLVHVFIPALFDIVGFTTNKKFIDLLAQERAVYLLNYVTTGKTAAEEHELLVPKLLCGFDPALAINKVKLLKGQLKEADHMLKSVIKSWEILKKTTPDGLREGFLQRKGKIYLRNEHIHFLVEKSGIDVLLDQLPWNLNILKYPWHKDFIQIEWR